MLIENMRSEVEDMYPGEKWKKRVARMSDKQVMAIYHSNYDRKKKSEEKRHVDTNAPLDNSKWKLNKTGEYAKRNFEKSISCEQLNFDDILRRKGG